MYFVGPINLLPEPRTLGGMGHGTPKAGIGIVQWIINTRGTTLNIHAHFYHLFNYCDLLLIPQQLFSTRGGVTVTFTICDKYDMISLDGKPYL